jgi:regulator of protease activity HflC (stomatin/prohibitin superfamily)
MPGLESLVTLFSSALPLLVVVLIVAYSLRILREYERGVVFLLGRFWKVKGPGLVIVVPFIQQIVRIDLRTRVLDVPPQDVISRDNVSVKVNAVVYRVMDPERAVIQVEEFDKATSQFAQTTLRSVVGQHELDDMLAEREKLNVEVQRILDARTDAWGIKVSNVELKHIDLNETMIRAIAKQAEAERLRRAKIIDAEASCKLRSGYCKPARSSPNSQRQCSCATSAPCTTLRAKGARPLFFPCRWTWQARLGRRKFAHTFEAPRDCQT